MTDYVEISLRENRAECSLFSSSAVDSVVRMDVYNQECIDVKLFASPLYFVGGTAGLCFWQTMLLFLRFNSHVI